MKVTLSYSNIAGALVAAFCGIALVGIIAYYVRAKTTTWAVPQLRSTLRKRVDPALNDRKAHFNNVAYNAGTRGTFHGGKTDLDDTSHGKCGEPPNKHIKLPEFDGLGYGQNVIVAPPDNHTEFTHSFAMSVTTALDFPSIYDTVPGSLGGDRHEFDDTASTVSAICTSLDNSDNILCGDLPPSTTPAKKSEHAKLRNNGHLCPIVSTPQPRAPKYARSRNKTIRGNHTDTNVKWSGEVDPSPLPVNSIESETYEDLQDVLNGSGSTTIPPANPIEYKIYEDLQEAHNVSGSTCAYVADKDSHPSVQQTSQASTGDEEQYYDIVEGLQYLVS